MWLLPGTGTEEIAARWPARPHQGDGQFPRCGALRLPIHPGSAGCGGPSLLLATLRGAGQCWGFRRAANWEPHQPLSSSHRQPMCAKGCPSIVCPKCALCIYIDIWCIQQAECISSFSPSGRRPVELCHAVFVPLSEGPVRHLAWHLMSSEVCTEVSAAVAPGDGLSAPLVLGPCAMAVCVRGCPVLGL